MRYVLVALVAAVGCKSAPSAPPPANQAPAPDYTATANDMLGFLPVDSDVVVGVDMQPLRASALWSKFKPQIDAFARQIEQQFGTQCGMNPIDTMERMTFAFKMRANGAMSGVMVAKGVDAPKMLQCFVDETNKSGSGKARIDRGMAIAEYSKQPGVQGVMAAVGPSTLVTQFDAGASYDTMTRVLTGGSPLRSSRTFMTLFERRERGAAAWGSANGNSPMFNELAQTGMRPTSVDGTLTVTDRVAIALRLGMPSPTEAARVKSEVDKVKGPATTMVERFDARADGATVAMDVVVTEAQLRALLGMLGGMMGSP